MNLKERLQQLAQQREQLFVALHEVSGAMKILEEQILETQETSEANQPSGKEASAPQEEAAPSE